MSNYEGVLDIHFMKFYILTAKSMDETDILIFTETWIRKKRNSRCALISLAK